MHLVFQLFQHLVEDQEAVIKAVPHGVGGSSQALLEGCQQRQYWFLKKITFHRDFMYYLSLFD